MVRSELRQMRKLMGYGREFEDMSQHVLFAVWISRGKYSPSLGGWRSWVQMIARRRCLNLAKSQIRYEDRLRELSDIRHSRRAMRDAAERDN